jgi:hypothetical protein
MRIRELEKRERAHEKRNGRYERKEELRLSYIPVL